MNGLRAAFERLELLRVELDAVTMSATYATAHGLVAIAVGPSGRVMTVNGERVPIEEAV